MFGMALSTRYQHGIDGYRWKCSTCNFTASLHSRSFFTKSKFSLPVLILFIYYWAKQSPQKSGFGGLILNENGDNRKSMNQNSFTENTMVGHWVFDGIERDSKRCFLVKVEQRDADTLLPLIEEFYLGPRLCTMDGLRIIISWNLYAQRGYSSG